MPTFLVFFAIFLYVCGVYFFLITKKYMGTTSFPIRILCFLLSPMMVPSVFYEIIGDYLSGNSNKRST